MLFGVELVRREIIRPRDFVRAVEQMFQSRPPIGELALKRGKLAMHQVFEILAIQTDRPKPFGRIAVEMNYLTETELAELLMLQADSTPQLSEILLELGVISRERLLQEQEAYYDSHTPVNFCALPATQTL
jgi:hypothetical protein